MPVTQAPDRSQPASERAGFANNRIDFRLRHRVLPAVMVVQLTAVIATTVVAAAGPRIASDLGALSLYPWIFSAYTITTAAFGPVVGKLSDLIGRRSFYVIGTSLFVLGSVGGALAVNMPELIAARAMAGAGGGALSALTGLTVADLYPPRQRARWLAATVGVYGAGSLIGPSIGGLVTDLWSWRWIFAGSIVAPLIATVLIVPLLPAGRRMRGLGIDVAGLALFLVAVTALLVAVTWAEDDSGRTWTPRVIAALALTVVGAGALLYREARTDRPFISLPMFKLPVFTISIAISFTVSVIFFAAIAYLPLYVQVVLGEGAAASGALLIPMMGPFIVGGVGGGQLIARSGRYRSLVITGCGLILVGTATFVVEPQGIGLFVGLGLLGLGAGAVFPVLSLVVQSAFPYRSMGAAHSLRQLFTSLAPAIGIPLMGLFVFHGSHLLTLALGAAERASLAQGLHDLFAGLVVLAALTLAMATALPTIQLRSSFDEES
jgi:MFS family permease